MKILLANINKTNEVYGILENTEKKHDKRAWGNVPYEVQPVKTDQPVHTHSLVGICCHPSRHLEETLDSWLSSELPDNGLAD